MSTDLSSDTISAITENTENIENTDDSYIVEKIEGWVYYPSLDCGGTTIKYIENVDKLSLNQMIKKANNEVDCMAFTTDGQIRKDIVESERWVYRDGINLYVRETCVPQIIHYYNKTHILTKLPKNIKQVMKHNMKTLKNWDYRLYTHDKIIIFIQDKYPKSVESYNQLTDYNKRIFAKLLILYMYGGAYFDMSTRLNKSIENLLTYNVILNEYISDDNENTEKNDEYEYETYDMITRLNSMIAEPGNILVKYLIDLFENKLNTVQNYDIECEIQKYNSLHNKQIAKIMRLH